MDIELWGDANFEPQPHLYRNIANCRVQGKRGCGASKAHLERQQQFYRVCAKHLHEQHVSTWVAFIDTDEYLTISSDAFPPRDEQIQLLQKQQGHILKIMKHFGDPGAAGRREDLSPRLYDQLQKTPSCMVVPRVLITAVESSEEEVRLSAPASIFNSTHFDTLRFRYRASGRMRGKLHPQDTIGKSVIDVSRLSTEDWNSNSSLTHVVYTKPCGGTYQKFKKGRIMNFPGSYFTFVGE